MALITVNKSAVLPPVSGSNYNFFQYIPDSIIVSDSEVVYDQGSAGPIYLWFTDNTEPVYIFCLKNYSGPSHTFGFCSKAGFKMYYRQGTQTSGAVGYLYTYKDAGGNTYSFYCNMYAFSGAGIAPFESYTPPLEVSSTYSLEQPTAYIVCFGSTEPVSKPLIKYATIKFAYPVEGLPLETTIVSATVDNGEVTAGTISWKKNGEPYTGNAIAGDRYTAVFTLQSTTAKFAQAIGQHISTINTAEQKDVYVRSVGAQFPTADLGLISVGVNFSAVGNTDPYYGDPDIESDPIEEPELPTLSAVDTGFLTLYNPTLTEVENLATYMWNADLTTIEFWKKVVADPIDMILGFSLVPCAVPDGGSKSVVIGAVDTGVSMTKAASQFVRIDCGSVTINEEYGNYLDYEPYTKCELYLPYCGTHPISIDDIMGKTVHITYHVDILSGACVAYVMVNEVVYYMFAGNCAVSLPVTSQQFSDLIRSSISLVADVGALVATGGLSAPLAGTGSQAAQIGRAIRGATMGIDTAAGAASTVMSMKPRMARSGNIGSMAGQLANQVPYFIFTHPRMSVADSQQSYQGYPTNQTYQLGSLSGFTQVQSIHLTGIPCTDDEITEIYSLLSAGVII